MPDRLRPASRTMLILGGVFTVAMATFHFFLPTVFGWAVEVKSVHPTVSWALFSLNCFFSFLLLALGVLSIAGVIKRRTHESMYLGIVSSAAGFWLLNGCYQVIAPMPMPHRLVLLSYFLRAYAFGVAMLFLVPMVSLAKDQWRSASPGPS